jgi:uncharacterized protein
MLVEAEIWTVARTEQGNAVLVRPLGTEVAVPIFIGQLEAQSILIGMGNVPMPRPLTHDLFLSILDKMEIKIVRIEITELKEGTFFAQLILKEKGKDIVIDSRPSDSIALAVREKCPIFIDESVIDEASVPVSVITEGKTEKQGGAELQEEKGPEEGPKPDSELAELQTKLNQAIEEENYEEAARIRDAINEYNQGGES